MRLLALHVGLLAAALSPSVEAGDPFIAEASARVRYSVNMGRDGLRDVADDIDHFKQHMPGVVEVRSLGGDVYLYRTAKELLLGGTMETDFVVQKVAESDSVTSYRSMSSEDDNQMFCTVRFSPVSPEQTLITIDLQLRLRRESGFDIHWAAPLVGSRFISSRMEEDLQEMLETFAARSKRELDRRAVQRTGRKS